VIALSSSVRELMWKLSGTHLVISPDTGPLHLAVALNIPTIGLYGYSNPRRCGPYKRFQELLIDKYNESGDELLPISRKTKSGKMALITPQEVIRKIELALEQYPIAR
jgi:heptosyltransferase I